jgi:glycosyltransferase involved in cell wall biosynthesis
MPSAGAAAATKGQAMAAKQRPRLSICIPTYNRVAKLEATLKSLAFARDADIEVVISDNASPDNTELMVRELARSWPGLKYYRQKLNHGAMCNHPATFRLANGEYALFLADDDRIDPAPMWEIVSFMESDPDMGVSFYGWHEWDDQTKTVVGVFNRIDNITVFKQNEHLSLFDYVVRRHIFPEMAVYRTRVVNKVQFQTHRMWAFHWWLWNHLRHGKVCFHPNIFYRNVLVFESGESNLARAGIGMAKRHVDDYRAGLESILFGAAMHMGLPLNTLVGPGALALLNAFTATRAEVAARLFLADEDYIASYEFYSQCLLWMALPADKIKELDEKIRVPAAVQALIGVFEQTPDMMEIALCEFDNPQALIEVFRRRRAELPIGHAAVRSCWTRATQER